MKSCAIKQDICRLVIYWAFLVDDFVAGSHTLGKSEAWPTVPVNISEKPKGSFRNTHNYLSAGIKRLMLSLGDEWASQVKNLPAFGCQLFAWSGIFWLFSVNFQDFRTKKVFDTNPRVTVGSCVEAWGHTVWILVLVFASADETSVRCSMTIFLLSKEQHKKAQSGWCYHWKHPVMHPQKREYLSLCNLLLILLWRKTQFFVDHMCLRLEGWGNVSYHNLFKHCKQTSKTSKLHVNLQFEVNVLQFEVNVLQTNSSRLSFLWQSLHKLWNHPKTGWQSTKVEKISKKDISVKKNSLSSLELTPRIQFKFLFAKLDVILLPAFCYEDGEKSKKSRDG